MVGHNNGSGIMGENDAPDVMMLFEWMIRSRLFEEAIKKMWDDGKIPGEMHMGIGEEGIMAGVMAHVREGDALALDHRGTAAMLMRGVDPKALLLECCAHPQGLCGGIGGHMHLFSKPHLAASSGIVGSSGPAAVGFAIASQYKNLPNIAIAFFGEGALNQGQMLESLNLAAAWSLPVLFVCKDNNWAITTHSDRVTGGTPMDRAIGFGITAVSVDGTDVQAVWSAAGHIIAEMRQNPRPYFLHATCEHNEGHFLGDPLLRFSQTPRKAFGAATGPLIKAYFKSPGAGIVKKTGSILEIFSHIFASRSQLKMKNDPPQILKRKYPECGDQFETIKIKVAAEIDAIVQDVNQILTEGV
jgi:pyruvate dehydrogenase E1 component alpha subunit